MKEEVEGKKTRKFEPMEKNIVKVTL